MRIISVDDLDCAVRAVEAGELVVLPTRRWYMICANARDRGACDRIFLGKGRARSKSLAYILTNHRAADELFIMTRHARQLASAFWPGDLAMILPWRDINSGYETVGVPNALVTLDGGSLGQLALRSSVPIAASTVNISDPAQTAAMGPAITVAEVQDFVTETGIEIAYCVDGGICHLANHLTVVDCTATEAVLIRSGAVHERAIYAALASCRPMPWSCPHPVDR